MAKSSHFGEAQGALLPDSSPRLNKEDERVHVFASCQKPSLTTNDLSSPSKDC